MQTTKFIDLIRLQGELRLWGRLDIILDIDSPVLSKHTDALLGYMEAELR